MRTKSLNFVGTFFCMKKEQVSLTSEGLKKLIRQKNGSWSHFLKCMVTRPGYIVTIISNVAIFFIPGLDLTHNAGTLLWIYLVQSILIGLVHVVKLNVYKFATPTKSTDWKNPGAISIFFILHYGFFHVVYTMFIPPSGAHWPSVMEGAAIFMLALLWNTFRHYKTENDGHYNANDFMFLPYVRIFPIHIAIILGGFFNIFTGGFAGTFIILAILKTGIELLLEYFQQLGLSFHDLQSISEE